MTRTVNMIREPTLEELLDSVGELILFAIERELNKIFAFFVNFQEFREEHTLALRGLPKRTGLNVGMIAFLLHSYLKMEMERSGIAKTPESLMSPLDLMTEGVIEVLQGAFGPQYHFEVIDGALVTMTIQESSWTLLAGSKDSALVVKRLDPLKVSDE